MAQIIPFPGVAAPAAAPAKKVTQPVATSFPLVRPISARVRIPKKNRAEDERTAMIARMARSYTDKANALSQIDPDGKEHRLALHMAGIDHKLPRNNLRCIVSTLDDERDFDLRCVELELLRAEHTLEKCRSDRLSILEGMPWWESPMLKALVDENNRRWDIYRERVVELAETPARTYPQLERKRRLIGKMWLEGENDWSARLRAGVEADEEWLAENRPKRRRKV